MVPVQSSVAFHKARCGMGIIRGRSCTQTFCRQQRGSMAQLILLPRTRSAAQKTTGLPLLRRLLSTSIAVGVSEEFCFPAESEDHDKSSSTYQPIDFQEKQKQRIIRELCEVATTMRLSKDSIIEGLATMEQLLPGFVVNLDAMKGSDWVKVITSPQEVARKLIIVKTHFPGLDLPKTLQQNPKVLLQDSQKLQLAVSKVAELLSEAKSPCSIITSLPQLLDPHSLVSVLVSLQRWFPDKNPVAVLQDDPDIIRRAQLCDIPLEPVFFDGTNYTAPSAVKHKKKQPWQR